MTRRDRMRVVPNLLLALALGACSTPFAEQDASNPTRRAAGRSVEGRPIEVIEMGEGSDVVLILATIHGSEPAGASLVRGLRRRLEGNPALLRGRRVLLVPVANPDGLARGRRHNARGIDLNRNFPADNFRAGGVHGDRPLAQPESRALHDLIVERRPARIVSLHQPHGCIDWDGPARALAEAMARACDLPVHRLGSMPGSLGSFAGETLGIPIVTVELPPGAETMDEAALWERYGRMLLVAVLASDAPPGASGTED